MVKKIKKHNFYVQWKNNHKNSRMQEGDIFFWPQIVNYNQEFLD